MHNCIFIGLGANLSHDRHGSPRQTLEAALDELPEEQRYVFVAHELEGRSFKELTAETGLGLNTLLSRKHYAVLHLRERLKAMYDEFKKTGGREK